MEIGNLVGISSDQLQQDKNYAHARNNRLENYQGICVTHGWQNFETSSKKCPLCRKRMGRPYVDSARTNARREGAKEFYGNCSVHGGPTPFSVKTNKCLRCYDTNGAQRVAKPQQSPANDRATARRRGARTFSDVCGVHGPAWFSVAHGRCLECYTAMGARRASMIAGGRPLTAGARAVARREGSKVYISWCDEHGGPAEFSVDRGKCLICYNSTGARRPK